ncbi:type I restriction enzyme HsdR N-terminal domain-containing protein [Sphingopyxis sp. JAI128]|uniref:type I restriction enzyme HsdR N-terminal domain-containing protein n=1 Tax=Sphingopyxis sp. JAI128 TaxID=2723066 RepID=UPI0016093764|nr:type I restriction enzyme HsdR N-terminal domain-containing protein [Sphingopyxis sp. JAI128]MBB6425421.1 putative type IV restriction endonuclease [Sphingopyxis sp. JAI128]
MSVAVKIPKKVQDRLLSGIKRYQPIVRKMVARDISEADTVTVIKDMLNDIFGYDKYVEVTSEQQIRGTFCDLAIKVEGKIQYLCEVKSAGTTLNDNHLRQAVNYGAHQGIEWVILSNAIVWKIYRIKFAQPIEGEEVLCFDFSQITRSADDIAKLFMLCRESINSETLDAFHRQAQIVNRYVIAATLLSDGVIGALRKEFRRLFDGLKVTDADLRVILANEVIKRDALDGDGATAAKGVMKKAEGSLRRKAARAAKSTASTK